MDGQRKPRFAELLSGMVKAVAEHEGKRVEVVNEELGAATGRGAAAMERYRNGRVPLRDPAVVRYLAETAVRRGLFGREWVRQFLYATGYPHPQALIAELGFDGAPSAPPPAPRLAAEPWYDNLAAAQVTAPYVPRRETLAALLEALAASPVVVLLGMGGTGKTSLAYHLGALCRERRAAVGGSIAPRLPGSIPLVQAVVWASAEQPDGAGREALIATITRTFDYAGLSALAPDEQEAAIQALLRRHQTLLILDNAESITDPTVVPWLLQLPHGTRVLLTTRQMVEVYGDERVRVVPLAGMSGPEARGLIKQQAAQIGYLYARDPAAQEALIQRTGGNPQALKQVLGYAKRVGQPLSGVIERFDALTGDLLADLFEHLWEEVLGDEARQLLVTLSLCRQPVARSVLGRVAGLSAAALDGPMAQLSDVSLLVEHATPLDDSEPRFGLHPLTRAFVQAQWAARADDVGAARGRLIAWAADYAGNFGYLLTDPDQLARLEADEGTLMEALGEAVGAGRYAEAVRLARGLEFYYYITCRWSDKLALHRHYIEAAAALGDPDEQITALTMHSQLLSRLNRPEEGAAFLERLAPLEAEASGEAHFHLLHARGLYYYTRGEHQAAQEQWARVLDQAGAWDLPEHMRVGAAHWLGLSRRRMGDRPAARRLFTSSLELARRTGIGRWVARNQLELAWLDIADGDPRSAGRRLDECRTLLAAADREQRAHLRRVEAWLWEARGQQIEALSAYRESRELFERMGLLHVLAEEDARFGPLAL